MKSFTLEKLALSVFLTLLSLPNAHADVILLGGIFVSNQNSDSSSDLELHTDLRLGYEFELSGASSLGLLGVLEGQQTSGPELGQDQSGTGVAVSYRYENAYVMAAYIFDVTDSSDEFVGLEDPSGQGFKFDIGYGWNINRNTIIGPRLSYKLYELDGPSGDLDFTRFQPLFAAFTRF